MVFLNTVELPSNHGNCVLAIVHRGWTVVMETAYSVWILFAITVHCGHVLRTLLLFLASPATRESVDGVLSSAAEQDITSARSSVVSECMCTAVLVPLYKGHSE